MAEAEVTELFDEHEIATRVEELARMAVDRLPGNFVIVGLLIAVLSLSRTLSARCIASAASRASNS